MCRTKSDRQTLVCALKRIVNPPESVAGQAAYVWGEQEYNRRLIRYMQEVAEHTLDMVTNDSSHGSSKLAQQGWQTLDSPDKPE